jgi:electron transport complex protein RnfC
MADLSAFVAWPGGRPSRGLNLEGNKHWTEDAPIEVLPTPKELKVPLTQHAGAPARAVVAPRQQVSVADLLAEATGFVSASVHSPVSGRVGRPSNVTLPNGRHVETLPLACGDTQVADQELYEEVLGGTWPTADLPAVPSEEILDAVQAAGIVGQGGAAFPTHVKLRPAAGKPIDTVLVNCIESEPYVTAGFRLIVEAPEAVVAGGLLAAQAASAPRVVLAVEVNRKRATLALCGACAGTRATVVEIITIHRCQHDVA